MKKRCTSVAFGLVAAALLPISASALTPQMSLNACQRAAKAEGYKFVKAEIAAMTKCLQAISTNLIQQPSATITNLTARTCIGQFRKINDTRLLGKSLREKLATKIRLKCEPGFGPMVTHALNDVDGHAGGGLAQKINTKNLDGWCQVSFGGDGSIDNIQEWVDCIEAAHQCEAEQAVAEQFPRASEWLSAVQAVMTALPPSATDPTKNSDAIAGVALVDAAIDSDNDGKPDLNCGAAPVAACSTACCYQEFGLGAQVSCFEFTGTAGQVSTFTTNCNGKASTPPGAWTMAASAGVCGNPPDFPTHTTCSAGATPASYVQIPKDSSCP